MCEKYDCLKSDCPLCEFLRSLPETPGFYNSPDDQEEAQKSSKNTDKCNGEEDDCEDYDYCY